MSFFGDGTDPLLIEEYVQSHVNYTSLLACLTVLLYDIFLNLGNEVEHIWKKRLRWSDVFYVLNRYLYPISFFLHIVSISTQTKLSCTSTNYAFRVIEILAEVSTGFIYAARIWAIWGKLWFPFVVILFLSLVTPAINVYRTIYFRFAPEPQLPFPWGVCQWEWALSVKDLEIGLWVGRGFANIGICSVLLATWLRTYRIRKFAASCGIATPFLDLIYRDGSLYFLMILLLDLFTLAIGTSSAGNGLVLHRADGGITQGNDMVMYLIDTFHCVLISRFILSLRTYDFTRSYEETSWQSQSPGLVFTTQVPMVGLVDEERSLRAMTGRSMA